MIIQPVFFTTQRDLEESHSHKISPKEKKGYQFDTLYTVSVHSRRTKDNNSPDSAKHNTGGLDDSKDKRVAIFNPYPPPHYKSIKLPPPCCCCC